MADAKQRNLEAQNVQRELRRIKRHLTVAPPLAVAAPVPVPVAHARGAGAAIRPRGDVDVTTELTKLALVLGDSCNEPHMPATVALPTTPVARSTLRSLKPSLPSPPESIAASLAQAARHEAERINHFLASTPGQ